jgi:hypothetical protein
MANTVYPVNPTLLIGHAPVSGTAQVTKSDSGKVVNVMLQVNTEDVDAVVAMFNGPIGAYEEVH